MEDHTAYDYRMYDRVWQRVSPGDDPYGDIRAAQNAGEARTMPCRPEEPAQSLSVRPAPPSVRPLPGEEIDPCCMGSAAVESIEVLGGFIEEELSQRRCYLGLAARLCSSEAAAVLRRLAQEKLQAARKLKAAWFLINGSCYETAVRMEHMCWNCAADALRSCYHREACNGFNYRRASEETLDPCLQKIFACLSEQAFERADAIMAILGKIIC